MITLLENANVILEDRVVKGGSLLLDKGFLSEVCPDHPGHADIIHNCQGHYLMPGIVDLHCDVIERDVEIRQGVYLPEELSIREADRRSAACGITTQFHGISFGHAERGLRDDGRAERLAQAIKSSRDQLLVDNRILLRYETASIGAEAVIRHLMDNGVCDMLSFMDHSPDSGVYAKILDSWRRGADQEPEYARLRGLALLGKQRGIPLGSHDDDSEERMEFLEAHGIKISEFPKTMEAARRAIDLGLDTVVGGPNAVRGESHLAWMSAGEALAKGVASAICSDYHPTILPQAVFSLYRKGIASLPEIVRSVSLQPARMAGLEDRGTLAVGKRADIVELAIDSAGWARVVNCWSRGRLVSSFPEVTNLPGAVA